MFKIKFQSHNSSDWRGIQTNDLEAAYQIACALNFTGFSYTVYGENGKTDITDAIETRMRADLRLPVCPVASSMNSAPVPLPSEASADSAAAAVNSGGATSCRAQYAKSDFRQGALYVIKTTSRADGFVFQAMSLGFRGMTGYIDGSASWPRTVDYSEIVSAEGAK